MSTGRTDRIRKMIRTILDDGRINGCITGSCMLDTDFDYWETTPDIDVFAYSPNYMIQAIEILVNSLGCKFGEHDTELQRRRNNGKLR